jgi:hypothetical protein
MLSKFNPVRAGKFFGLLKQSRKQFTNKSKQMNICKSMMSFSKRNMCQTDSLETAQQKQTKDVVSSTPRGLLRLPYTLKVGDPVHGFTVKSIDDFPEFKIKAFTLEHERTGAKYIHLDSADLENVRIVHHIYRHSCLDSKHSQQIAQESHISLNI